MRPKRSAVLLRRWLHDRWILYAACITYLLLVMHGIPGQNLLNPTFNNDDGNVYFQYAYHHSWLAGLLQPHHSYYELWPNLMGVLSAKLMPLESAPAVTMVGGFAIWLLLGTLIVMQESPFRTNGSKAAALLLTILIPPSFGDYATCLTHFYVCACAVLVLISDTSRRPLVYRGVLVFCALNGPVVLFLLPVFVLDYWLARNRERLIHLLILTVGLAIQLTAYLSTREMIDPSRFTGLGEIDAYLFWVYHRAIIQPLFGNEALHRTGHYVVWLMYSQDGIYWGLLLICAFSVAVWLMLMADIASFPHNRNALLLTFAFVCVSVLNFYTSLTGPLGKAEMLYDHSRYFFTPAMFMAWAFILNAQACKNRGLRWFYGGLTAYLLVAGGWIWSSVPPLRDIPDWRQEVRQWRDDPSYPLKIVPRHGVPVWLVPSDKERGR